MSPSPLVDEIRAALAAAAGGREPAPERKYNKEDEYVSFGLSAPMFYAVMKGFRPQIKALALAERLDLADALLSDGIGEMGHAGIAALSLSTDEFGPEHFERLDRMLDGFTGWSHVDDFCISVAQPLLLAYPDEAVAQLRKWNASPNRWKRRTSVVTFVRKVGGSGRFTDPALELCEGLVFDEVDLVRKGVGWCLKDVMRGDHDRVVAYVKELRRRGVPAVVTLYAIRDLKGAERASVLAAKAK